MKKEEVEAFIKKASGFEDLAVHSFQKSRYDLAIFCLEQAVQIYLKAKLYELIGEFPRTHDVVKLLEGLSIVYRTEEVRSFISEHLDELTKLVDAYITSRYYIREFYKEEIEKSFEMLKKLKELLSYD